MTRHGNPLSHRHPPAVKPSGCETVVVVMKERLRGPPESRSGDILSDKACYSPASFFAACPPRVRRLGIDTCGVM